MKTIFFSMQAPFSYGRLGLAIGLTLSLGSCQSQEPEASGGGSGTGPAANFSASTQSVDEDDGTITVTVNLASAATANASIPYTVSGTSSNPADHNLSSGTLTITAGSSSGNISIVLANDGTAEKSETIVLTMGTPTNAQQGSTTTHTITISDEDAFLSLLPGGGANANAVYPTAASTDATSIDDSGNTALANLSGVTHCPTCTTGTYASGTYLVIRNNDLKIHEFNAFSAGANAVRNITLTGFASTAEEKDLEDIVYLGLNGSSVPEVALVNEVNQVFICPIADGDTSVDESDCSSITLTGISYNANKGLEGIAYDSTNRRFYVAREGAENGTGMGIYYFDRPDTFSGNVAATQLFNADTILGTPDYADDLSSICFDPRTERLLIMSHVSARILEVKTDGTVMGRHALPGSRQYEGLTLNSNYDLITVSEADYATIYNKQ